MIYLLRKIGGRDPDPNMLGEKSRHFLLKGDDQMNNTFVEEKRRYERYPIYCPLEYKDENVQPKESSVTLNISEGGALISARRKLEVSSNIIMKFRLKNDLLFLIGKIKHVRQDVVGDSYEIGVEFRSKPRTFVRRLYEELDEIRALQKRQSEQRGAEISLAEASIEKYQDVEIWPR